MPSLLPQPARPTLQGAALPILNQTNVVVKPKRGKPIGPDGQVVPKKSKVQWHPALTPPLPTRSLGGGGVTAGARLSLSGLAQHVAAVRSCAGLWSCCPLRCSRARTSSSALPEMCAEIYPRYTRDLLRYTRDMQPRSRTSSSSLCPRCAPPRDRAAYISADLGDDLGDISPPPYSLRRVQKRLGGLAARFAQIARREIWPRATQSRHHLGSISAQSRWRQVDRCARASQVSRGHRLYA